MTDNLTTKFSGFEDLITSNHTELIDLLNSIATTIGAPPTGPTTTLSDVVTALTQTNVLLAGIRSDQSDQATALLDVANALYANSEIMIENTSTNTQALLKAIYATFCDCVTTTPVLPPPVDVTPTPLEDDEKCKRIQFYISLFTTWLTKLANYTATGASLTSGILDSLLALSAAEAGIVATGAEVGTVGGIPGVVIASVVALIAGAVYLLGSAILNDYLADFQSPIFQNALLEAMYAATNADEGQAAFESVVGANFAAVPSGILAALWWSQWSNDMYSDTPVVDTSAFDGSICAPPEPGGCVDIEAVAIGDFWQVVFPDETTNYAGDFIGSTIKVLHSGTLVNVVLYHDGTYDIVDITSYTSSPYTIAIHTTSIQINVDGHVSGQFGVTWCDNREP